VRDLSAGAKTALYAQQTDTALILLLTVRMVTGAATTTLRVTDVPGGVTSRGQSYEFLPIRLRFPSDTEDGRPRAEIVIDNVHRDIGVSLRAAEQVELDADIVLSSDPEHVEISWDRLRLIRASWDAGLITGTLGYDSSGDEPYPAQRFTPQTSPGVF